MTGYQAVWWWYQKNPKCKHREWETDAGCYRVRWPWYWRVQNTGPYPFHTSGCPSRGVIYSNRWMIGPLELRKWNDNMNNSVQCTCYRK